MCIFFYLENINERQVLRVIGKVGGIENARTPVCLPFKARISAVEGFSFSEGKFPSPDDSANQGALDMFSDKLPTEIVEVEQNAYQPRLKSYLWSFAIPQLTDPLPNCRSLLASLMAGMHEKARERWQDVHVS
jgi:hypothetical protein